MKSMRTIIAVFVFSLALISTVSAKMEIRATSPQDINGTIALADADSFHVDIWMNNTVPNSEFLGGTFAFQLYSPDNSIRNITHLGVTDGKGSTSSIEFLNGLETSIFDLAAIPIGNGWGGISKASHSVGNLPDSISFTLIGLAGLTDAAPEMPFIRLNLHCDGPGTICIDSISNPGDDIWDWLFPRDWSPASFDGPYCWEIVGKTTAISADANNDLLPTDFALSQNYPNPFNPSTNIELALPVASEWKIAIYNVVGRKVEEFSGFDEAGYLNITWDASNVSSGVYFYKATAGDFSATRKMVLLK